MVTYKINERSKMKENIRKEIMGMNLAELNELGEFIRDVKVMNAKSTIRVGMDVYVVQKTKRELGTVTKINIKKALCGRSMVISFGKKTLYTRSLMIADLSKEESLKLQEEGVGDKKLYGCGIFLPHKSIDAVNNFKED